MSAECLWNVCSVYTRLTFSGPLLRFGRPEVDGGHGTDELHWRRFDQTSILPVPAGALQMEAFDINSALRGLIR